DRVREFNPGDQIAFRPFFFLIIASEKWFFGYNFMYWQIVSFLLHLAVMWWLLKLLQEIDQNLFGVFLCLLCSVLFISMEMVIWHHLHGYQVFSVLALAALYNFYVYLREGKQKLWRIWTITASLLVAAFSYEMGMLLSIIFALYLASSYWGKQPQNDDSTKSKRWAAVALLLPCIVYVIVSASDFVVRGTTAPEGYAIWNKLDVGTTARNALYTEALWFLGGILPLGLHAIPQERIIMRPLEVLPWDDASKMSQLVLSGMVGVALITIYTLVLVKGVTKAFLQERWVFIFLLLTIVAAYTLMIVIGRINMRGLITLTYSVYYSYVFWIFFVVLIYTTINFGVIDKNFFSGIKILVFGSLMILIYINSSL
ncbi:MAG: hypothetical protein ACREBU_24090, partial [Nitrososphaera sp.]